MLDKAWKACYDESSNGFVQNHTPSEIHHYKWGAVIMRFVMSSVSKQSVKDRVLAFLAKPEGYNTLSAAQMKARFGVTNPSSLVSRLRNEGYAIYRNTRKRGDGSTVGIYRLGTHSASMLDRLSARGISPRTV